MSTSAQYNHSQTASNATWTISHNLASDSVVVDVMVDNGGNLEKIIPQQIVITDSNTVTVTFSSAQTGRARVVGEFE